jgi:hypothetical protein
VPECRSCSSVSRLMRPPDGFDGDAQDLGGLRYSDALPTGLWPVLFHEGILPLLTASAPDRRHPRGAPELPGG